MNNKQTWLEILKHKIIKFKLVCMTLITGDTATNLINPEFQKLLKDKDFSDDLYEKIHSKSDKFTIKSKGVEHKFRKIKLYRTRNN
jgi:hypothetical protein